MAHKQQIDFCNYVKTTYPDYFINKKVLDLGSLAINGNNRFLFTDCDYFGVDIVEGNNVDLVQKAHTLPGSEIYDVIISTEMLEHDKFYKESIAAMYRLLKQGGLMMFSCATTGRAEHGTSENKPQDSPLTNSYYKNITKEMLLVSILGFAFDELGIVQNTKIGDIYFWGVKSCL